MYRTIKKTFVGTGNDDEVVNFPVPHGGQLMYFWLEQDGDDELSVDLTMNNRHGALPNQFANLGLDNPANVYSDLTPGSLTAEVSGATEDVEYTLCALVAEGNVRHYAVRLEAEGEGEAATMAGYFDLKHGGQFMQLWFDGPAEASENPKVTCASPNGPGRSRDIFDQGTIDVRVLNYGNWETAMPGRYRVEMPADPNEEWTVHVYIFCDGSLG